jgi:hypothetical protein
MGMVPTAYKVILPVLACTMLSMAAHAEPAAMKPLSFKGRYSIAWSGIPLGRVLIEAKEDASSYSMSIDTKTRGIGSLITDAAQVVAVEGKITPDGTYLPSKYFSRPHKKDNLDFVKLSYDAAGKITKRERGNDDDPAWRPPVPFEKVNTGSDPVTGAFSLRRKLHAVLANPSAKVSTNTYDGMRLAEMSLIRGADARVAIMDAYMDTVNVAITRKPMDGYTPKELKKYNKGDPEIRLYFSNDADFLPVRATAKVPLGELSMTLVEKY